MNNKLTFPVLLLSISIIGFAQDLPPNKTSSHQQITGTNIFIVPPALFKLSGNFKGFQNPDDPTSMIMTMEIPGPYSEVTKGFTAEMVKTKGMDLRSKKEIRVADFNGLLIELEQPTNGMLFSKYILIYGNEKSTTFINGVYLKDSLLLGDKIRESILTAFVEFDLQVNPRAALDYSIDENVGSLKFKAVIGNGMLFNRDLKTPTESIDKASLLTDKSFAKVTIDNEKLFCISRIKKYNEDYTIITGKGINKIEIDSLNGYELYAKNNDKENEELYQVILFIANGGYFIFVGTYLKGNPETISDLRKIIMTFKRKNNGAYK